MKINKVLSLLLAMLMVLSMLAACGDGQDTDVNQPTNGNNQQQGSQNDATTEKGDNNDDATTDSGDNNDEDEDEDNADSTVDVGPVSYDKLPSSLTAQKIGSIKHSNVSLNNNAGLIYRDENGLYGILTIDGKKDTGAKYTSCEAVGEYFMVTTSQAEPSLDDLTTLNCIGVVDATGKEIVPMSYAVVKKINERYVRVCEVTEQTTNEEEALVYFTNDMFSLTADEDDVLFKGVWYVYDMIGGKKMEGVTGTKTYNIYSNGDFIQYTTDDGVKYTINHKGEPLPETADLFTNGYYAMADGNVGVVYNSEGEKIFEYALDGFVPTDSEDIYILASKYENSTRSYVLMDYTGKVVSAEFTDMPYAYGKLVHSGNKVYNLKGELVIEGTYKYMYIDDQLRNAWFLKNDDEYTLITEDGTVLYKGTDDDTFSFDAYSTFSIYKNVDNKQMYYSLADKDFTLEGYSLAPWLIRVTRPNYVYDVADAISGQTIINGYQRYLCIAVPGAPMYVYAYKGNGGVDIYIVK